MTPFVGKSLQTGKYLLQEEIEQGFSSISYKAINQVLKKPVIIKTLNLGVQENAHLNDLRKKFLNEARRLVKCSHPNIIKFREFFVEEELPYIVMDFIPGQSLESVVMPDKPLSEAIAVGYIRQAAEALKVVHRSNLLHRNITPHNLVLRQGTKQVILTEFGIAREFLPGAVQTHTNVTSEGYAPIEQYLPKAKRTPATDVYGLAATLYTLLTARVPTSPMLRQRIPLATPQSLRPDLNPKLCEAVMLGMALEQKDRPSSVDKWLSLLPNNLSNAAPRSMGSTPRKRQLGDRSNSQEVSTRATGNSLKQSNSALGLIKIVIIAGLLFAGFDYIWLKIKADFLDNERQPQESNTETK
ncbi:MAG: serine/threonine-protein kinase [Prochloraceae cyanobacterium]|nr:serine/threonine-protein kinase [Prochloraceae cyanobacterium]